MKEVHLMTNSTPGFKICISDLAYKAGHKNVDETMIAMIEKLAEDITAMLKSAAESGVTPLAAHGRWINIPNVDDNPDGLVGKLVITLEGYKGA